MRFAIAILIGLLVLTGCASGDVSPVSEVGVSGNADTPTANPTPKEDPREVCERETDRPVGVAPNQFGAEAVVAAWCEYKVLTLSASFQDALLTTSPEPSGFGPWRSHLVPSLRDQWDRDVAAALSGDRQAISTVGALVYFREDQGTQTATWERVQVSEPSFRTYDVASGGVGLLVEYTASGVIVGSDETKQKKTRDTQLGLVKVGNRWLVDRWYSVQR